MIVQPYEDRYLVIKQHDHALQVGAMARHWGNEEMPGYEPRHLMIETAARHDNGWVSLESRPAIDPESGGPLQFTQVPPRDHIPAHRRGIDEAVNSHPWVGLLVSLHTVGLYNDRYGTWKRPKKDHNPEDQAIITEFVQEQERVQRSLAQKVLDGPVPNSITDHPTVWQKYLLLQVWDRLSLQFTWRSAADAEIAPLPRADEGQEVLRCTNRGDLTLALDPYPFDESPCALPVQARILRKLRYKGPEELLEEFLTAPVVTIEYRAIRR